MTAYMIHAVPRRMWYVEEYLIPSLTKQGIAKSQIVVYNDIQRDGNLRACMKAFSECVGDGGTWHLQDDVCICKHFKTLTEIYDDGVVCGFSSEKYDGKGKIGTVGLKEMWFSFPCIRIPNDYARECSKWVQTYIIGNPIYKDFWVNGVNDDWAFRMYLKTFHPKELALNITPNLVDHVDWLIGGSTGEKARETPVRAQYWVDNDLISQLEESINARS